MSDQLSGSMPLAAGELLIEVAELQALATVITTADVTAGPHQGHLRDIA